MTSAEDRIRALIHTLYDEGYSRREVEGAMRRIDSSRIILELIEEDFVDDLSEDDGEWKAYYETHSRWLSVNHPSLKDVESEKAYQQIEEKAASLGYRVDAKKIPSRGYRVHILGRFEGDDDT